MDEKLQVCNTALNLSPIRRQARTKMDLGKERKIILEGSV